MTPRSAPTASALLFSLVLALALAATLGAPAFAQGAIPEGTTRVIHIASIEEGCPDGKNPCWDIDRFAVKASDKVHVIADMRSGSHDFAVKAPVDKKTETGRQQVETLDFDVPSTFKNDGQIEFYCTVHPVTMVGFLVGPGAISAGAGAHEDVPEMGVHFLAYWVGVIAFGLLFIVYGITFFLFKYNETSATTDHWDRGQAQEGAKMSGGTATLLAVVLAIVAVAAVVYVARFL